MVIQWWCTMVESVKKNLNKSHNFSTHWFFMQNTLPNFCMLCCLVTFRYYTFAFFVGWSVKGPGASKYHGFKAGGSPTFDHLHHIYMRSRNLTLIIPTVWKPIFVRERMPLPQNIPHRFDVNQTFESSLPPPPKKKTRHVGNSWPPPRWLGCFDAPPRLH